MRDDEYELIRSKRKSLSIEIRADGRIIVRVPMRIPLEEVREFVNSKESWIRTHQKIAKERAEALNYFLTECTPENLVETEKEKAKRLATIAKRNERRVAHV